MKYIFIVAIVLSLCACKTRKEQGLDDKQKEIEIGTLDSANTYTYAEIGWTVKLPKGWPVQTKENTKRLKKIGESLAEDALDQATIYTKDR